MLNKKGFGIPVALMVFGAGIFCLAPFANKFSTGLAVALLAIVLIGTGLFSAINLYEKNHPDHF